ncbi:MAG: hypothetical protein H0V04_08235, partial [Chloroflexi bacterium]|nr:hypothetical protein [Chloroflexota bacterium]
MDITRWTRGNAAPPPVGEPVATEPPPQDVQPSRWPPYAGFVEAPRTPGEVLVFEPGSSGPQVVPDPAVTPSLTWADPTESSDAGPDAPGAGWTHPLAPLPPVLAPMLTPDQVEADRPSFEPDPSAFEPAFEQAPVEQVAYEAPVEPVAPEPQPTTGEGSVQAPQVFGARTQDAPTAGTAATNGTWALDAGTAVVQPRSTAEVLQTLAHKVAVGSVEQ